jgi:hypothetical protein
VLCQILLPWQARKYALASPQQTASDQRKALNFAQGGNNNESDNFFYLLIFDHLANLLSRLLQQQRRWMGGGKVWEKEGSEGWDQVRGGRGRGERRRQRERCAAHTCCAPITPLSLTAQQSQLPSSASIRCASKFLIALVRRSLNFVWKS